MALLSRCPSWSSEKLMLKKNILQLAAAPTPMAGLALGIASLGWCWENAAQLHGLGQIIGAVIASAMLFILLLKFVCFPKILWNDLAHPVVGSVAPTFAMATMVVSNAVTHFNAALGNALWLFAVVLHLLFLVVLHGIQ